MTMAIAFFGAKELSPWRFVRKGFLALVIMVVWYWAFLTRAGLVEWQLLMPLPTLLFAFLGVYSFRLHAKRKKESPLVDWGHLNDTEIAYYYSPEMYGCMWVGLAVFNLVVLMVFA